MKFKSGGLHKKRAVATWSLGNHRLPNKIMILSSGHDSDSLFHCYTLKMEVILLRNIANSLLQTGRHIPETSDLRELCCECLRSITDLSRLIPTANVLLACTERTAVLFGWCILATSCEIMGPPHGSDVLAKAVKRCHANIRER
jgi:hypothetical protein